MLALDQRRDSQPQMLGYCLATPLGDHASQLGLEVERAETRRATVEVAVDQRATFLGELTLKKVVQLLKRFLAGTKP